MTSRSRYERQRGGTYVVHTSAARRRVKLWTSSLLLMAAAVALLALMLVGSRIVENRPSHADNAKGSRQSAPGPLDAQDGYVAVGASLSPFSDEPAIANLDPSLREAIRQAAGDAGAEEIELLVNGGWRSARYQRDLLRRAIETYGSREAARRYVMPPDQSSHVTGTAVDIGPATAATWLFQHGATYGLCRIYENEPWHFEPATTPGGACPPMTSNAAGG